MNEKKFFRVRNGKIIAGVCGGLGSYFNVDPLIIRILFLGTLFLGGLSLFIYAVLWVIAPFDIVENSNIEYSALNIETSEKTNGKANKGNLIIGLLFIGGGVLMFFKEFINLSAYQSVALVLIALGVYLIYNYIQKGK